MKTIQVSDHFGNVALVVVENIECVRETRSGSAVILMTSGKRLETRESVATIQEKIQAAQ